MKASRKEIIKPVGISNSKPLITISKEKFEKIKENSPSGSPRLTEILKVAKVAKKKEETEAIEEPIAITASLDSSRLPALNPTRNEEVNHYLQQYYEHHIMTPDAFTGELGVGNLWMLSTSEDRNSNNVMQWSNAMLYANGRFQGLVPGISREEGYGGHPGLFNKLIII